MCLINHVKKFATKSLCKQLLYIIWQLLYDSILTACVLQLCVLFSLIAFSYDEITSFVVSRSAQGSEVSTADRLFYSRKC